MIEYSPEERAAAKIIASLIYPDYPSGPDLETDSSTLGLLGPAVNTCRDPYEFAAITMPLDGILRDCTGDAATAWEGLRLMSSAMRPYARIDPLIRELGGAIQLPPLIPAKLTNGNGTHPPTEYAVAINPLSGTALMAKNIPPTRHFVKDIIRTGLCFFIGQPGVGKTPALVQLAVAYATGGLWLGTFRVPKIKVAYIGPEYDEGDTRNTIMESTCGRANLDNLLIFTVENFIGPNSEAEAMQLIDDLVRIHHVEAIIIDLFTGFLPPEKFKQNAYRGDYREFLAYHRAALSHNMSIVGAWHGTKRDANPATMYNGGQGFWGSAGGGRLVMYQDDTDSVKLYTQLRGSKAMTYSLVEANIAGCRIWSTLEGSEPEPAFGSDVHRAIYYVIKEHAPIAGISPKTIYSLVKPELEKNVSEAYIRKCLGILTKRGLLRMIGDGYVIKNGGTRRSEGSEGTRDTEGSEGSGGSEPDFDENEDESGTFTEPLIPSDPIPIPFPIPSDSASYRAETSSDPSDPSFSLERDIFSPIARGSQVTLRLFLRSNKEVDQERARELCADYGIDYALAYAEVNGHSPSEV